MAKLELTEEEKKAASFLEWSDKAIAGAVRYTAAKILSDEKGSSSVQFLSLCNCLCCMAAEANSENTTIEIGGLEKSGERLGNWIVNIKKVEGES
ncbi:MAG: hypothetical protein MJH10_09675 [Epibacterium sp.]|nr:hypothetical protein [Epibacterium sp.]NQX73804.1 hypothetical protein [Epibacterium sp.]